MRRLDRLAGRDPLKALCSKFLRIKEGNGWLRAMIHDKTSCRLLLYWRGKLLQLSLEDSQKQLDCAAGLLLVQVATGSQRAIRFE